MMLHRKPHIWTFSRDVRSDDQNWLLGETDAA
jgi:predicted lipid-binding transport protein (Tim44 family)